MHVPLRMHFLRAPHFWRTLHLLLSFLSLNCSGQHVQEHVPLNIEEALETLNEEIDELKADNENLKERVTRIENCIPYCGKRDPDQTTSEVQTGGRECNCVHGGRCDAGGGCECPTGYSGPSCQVTCSNPCLLRGPDPGQSPCPRAPSTRFYFDPVKRQCQPFQYSGCGGNANNFENTGACEERCLRGACCFFSNNVSVNFQLSIRCMDMSESQCRSRGDVVTFRPGLPSVKVKVFIENQCMDLQGEVHSEAAQVRMGCQTCTCIKDQGLTRWKCGCDRVWQRRELRDLRPSEVIRWQAALRRLRQNAGNSTSPWEDLRDLYVRHVMVAQNPRYFLAWHRMYLRLVEQKLQEVDCSLTIPYFDFTTDSGAFHQAIIWQPNYFGGSSGHGSCVTDHPFDHNNDSRFCIERPFNRSVVVPTVLDVIYALKTDSLLKLSSSLQTIMAHIHMFIGGTMMTPSSPLDPVFLPLYAFMDQLFWFWQKQHPNMPRPPMAMSVQDVYHRPLAPFSTALKHIWDSQNDLCVTYITQGQGCLCNRTEDDSWLVFKDRFTGYSPDGYDQNGFDISGYDRNGYDREGFDIYGRNKFGFDRFDNSRTQGAGSCRYTNGYDQNGFNIFGYDRNGYDRSGCNCGNKGPHITSLVARVWKFYFRQRISFLSSLPRYCPGMGPVNPVWVRNMWITNFQPAALPDWSVYPDGQGPYSSRLCIEINPVITRSCECDNPTVCRSNPCEGATCQTFPNALCLINVCGQTCEPYWLWRGEEVSCPRPPDAEPTCQHDGRYYYIGEEIESQDPCQDCRCESGGVKCMTKTCRPLNCVQEVKLPGQCCPVCQETKSCSHRGRIFQEGATIPSRRCERCVCESGRVRCSRVSCQAAQCSHPATPRGACCPVCSDCAFENQYIPNNQSVSWDCNKCQCLNGEVTCERLQCPQLSCSNPVTTPGKCCPMCPSAECYHNRKVVPPGESVVLQESCEECVCSHTQLVCGPIRCPATPCRHPSSGRCCPVCQGCRYGGQEYRNDAVFVDPRQPCLSCHCRDGNVICSPKECQPVTCTHPQLSVDGCCPECEACLYRNNTYTNRQRFQDGCDMCVCETGSVRCQAVQCPIVSCRHPTSEGCCPSCDRGCAWQGRVLAEGQKVTMNDLCESCECQRGDVKCTKLSCPPATCSHPTRDHCCAECENCLVEGTVYRDGQAVRSENPCEECICQKGNKICQRTTCPPAECTHPVQGRCCAVCSGCHWNGQVLREGDVVEGSPCETCRCERGSVKCQKAQCPELNCLHPVQHECCPSCDHGCMHEGRTFPEGASIPAQGRCRQCRCSRGSVRCTRVTCPPIECTHPTQGTCCQKCSKCLYNGTTFDDGQTFRGSSPCEECRCSRGSVTCARRECPPQQCQHPVQGQCCPRCDRGCSYRQRVYPENSQVPSEKPCEDCVCQRGTVDCRPKTCPAVTCRHPVRSNCCAECNSCSYEGQVYVHGQEFISADSCQNCRCVAGTVTCSRKPCGDFQLNCRNPSVDPCGCKMCRTQLCRRGDILFNEGDIVPSGDPCETCRCDGGSIQCQRVPCQPVSCRNPATVGCCPECNSCSFHEQIYPDGQEIDNPQDKCSICVCQLGNVICQRRPCPVPTCSNPVSDGCCQICPEKCIHGNISVENGQSVVDHCNNCTCQNGSLQCQNVTCPPTRCRSPEVVSGQCCPSCRDDSVCTIPSTDEKLSPGKFWTDRNEPCHTCLCEAGELHCRRDGCSLCVHHGLTHNTGEKWQVDECTACQCVHGQVVCETQRCQSVTCADQSIPTMAPGRCCPVCRPKPGICLAFGDPHYITFDGLLVHFQGLCTYIMAADCVDGLFQVKAKHDNRGCSGSVSWIQSLNVQLTLNSSVLIIDLFPGGHVKINGNTATLPFLYNNDISVERSDTAVIVNTRIGLQVLWSGDGYVELSVSSQYKDNLCGLCGNFNGFHEDDLMTSEGTIASSPAIFGNSWKDVESNCITNATDIHPCTTVGFIGKKYAEEKCQVLKGEVFAQCHNYVRPEEFYTACLYDVCGCAELSQEKCLCDILASYARECNRAGISLNWRSPQLCGVGCPAQAGFLWEEYGPTCARTCDNRDLPMDQLSRQCIKPCVAGCRCSPDLVLHDGTCIMEPQCP